jgi:hypothetical protein
LADPGRGFADHAPLKGWDRPMLGQEAFMVSFLLWLILLIICWPLALLALVLYPLVWLLLLPFRLLGFAVEGVFGIVRSLFLLPGRLLGR